MASVVAPSALCGTGSTLDLYKVLTFWASVWALTLRDFRLFMRRVDPPRRKAYGTHAVHKGVTWDAPHVSQLAQGAVEQTQQHQREQYNKRVKVGTFSPRQKVLLLLPASQSILLKKWQEPFKVMHRQGPVNYVIKFPLIMWMGLKSFHVNLLNIWLKDEEVRASYVERCNGPPGNEDRGQTNHGKMRMIPCHQYKGGKLLG